VRHPHSDQLSATGPVSAVTVTAADADRLALTALVLRAQQGELDAQSDLVRRYSHRIGGFIRTIVHQSNVIEDITQTVFIKMVRRVRWLRDPVSFEAWLFAMARSTALDHLRSRRRRPELLADDPEQFDAADPSHPHLLNEITEALELALTHLSPKDQTLVRLVVEGHSYQTIAAREGLTLGAVKARLTRVRPFLRAAVGLATGTRQPADHETLPTRARLLAAA
jgi:RNA polymerase sigma-70 factor (ECF subfamily)